MLMTHHESRTPGVLFTGMWRYKPSHGAVGALMCTAGCILLIRVMLLFFQDEEISPEKVRNALALFFGGGVLFYIGTTLFFSLITGYAKRLVISEDGVRYASTFYSWKNIQWIDARLRRGTYQVCIRRRRGLFRQKWFIIDDGLSEEQRQRLIKLLHERVMPRHAKLHVGDAADSIHETRETAPVLAADPPTDPAQPTGTP